MKRFASLLSLAVLLLLVSCRPNTPKVVPAKPEPTLPTTTASVTLTASTPTESTATTAAVTIPPTPIPAPQPPPPPVLPPAPLLGPSTVSASTPAPTSGSIAMMTPPPIMVPPPVTAKAALRLLAPEGQLSDSFKQDLAAKVGSEVIIDTYASNDEAVKKLSAEGPAYSLALVSYRIVPHLISEQKLAALPTLAASLAPAPKFLHHFYDRDNKYSLPYAYSLAGMAVRAEIKTPPVTWGQLFLEANFTQSRLPQDSAFISSLAAKANLRNSTLSSSATTEGESRPIQVDSVANLKKKFATQPGWRFVLPGEGSVIFLWNVVIPANSPFPDKSAAWLAAFLAPENTTRIAEDNYLGVTQPAALKLLPAVSTGDLAIYPRAEILDRCIFVRAGYRPIPAPASTPAATPTVAAPVPAAEGAQ